MESSEPVEVLFGAFIGRRDGDLRAAGEGDVEDLSPKEVGRLGEFIAESYLMELGYDIVRRNYRCPEGEADLIAYDEASDLVVLVEVKTRRAHRGAEDGYPEEAVTKKKQRRYRRIASCFVMENYPTPAVRFDVVAVTLSKEGVALIRHVEGAFDWDADL